MPAEWVEFCGWGREKGSRLRKVHELKPRELLVVTVGRERKPTLLEENHQEERRAVHSHLTSCP